MNVRITTLIAALALAALPMLQASAADATKPASEKKLSSSQQRMVDCNKEATGKKGTERRDFMRQCMHKDSTLATGGAPAAASAAAPKNRMQECNDQAKEKGVKSPDRRAFMSDCLKNK
jgi:Ni/Co efflux regulator RcnB